MSVQLAYDNAIAKYLQKGESLLWVGRPRQGWAYRWHNRLALVQVLWAFVLLRWLFGKAVSAAVALGLDLGVRADRPTPITIGILLLGAGVTGWQLYMDRRRRAGTWYAVTDRRVLFVQTNVWPESMVSVAFEEIAGVQFDVSRAILGLKRESLTIALKQIDPYVAGSTVLGYMMSAGVIELENIVNAREMYQAICVASGRQGTGPRE